MGRMKIGVMVDSFRTAFREGVAKAAALGAEGIQVYAVSGEMAPENITSGQIAEKKAIGEDNGLVISALCGDLGGHGFERKRDNIWRVEKSKRIVDLALSLGTTVVTTHIGVVPEDAQSEQYESMQAACAELGEYAEKAGAVFAIETGPEPAMRLCGFLDSLGTKGIGVNFDPANLAMVTDDDPVAGVSVLREYIVHTHAKDGVLLRKTDPAIIYNFFAEGGIGDLRLGDYFQEVPLGEGKVDFDRYFEALRKIGYQGFLTVEREVGEDPEKDIGTAVHFLRDKLNQDRL